MRSPDLTGRGGATVSSLPGANGTAQQNLTGRYIILFRKDRTDEAVALLRSAGHKVFVHEPFEVRIVSEDQTGDANVVARRTIGSATADLDVNQMAQIEAWAKDPTGPIQAIQPEKIRRVSSYEAVGSVNASAVTDTLDKSTALDAYRTVVADLVRNSTPQAPQPVTAAFDESQTTWGLQVTNVLESGLSGRGVKVAVLDTGIDFTVDSAGNRQYHPDFRGRNINAVSFVPGAPTAKDGNGHGTHCVGTACGPRNPSILPGYGVAHKADIYVVKVLNDQGSGVDGWIQDGIEWAINQGCRVISMSLGAFKRAGDPFNATYEEIAQRAMEKGTVIIAAAGNDSVRSGNRIEAVNGPADCPSIIAVGALDEQLRVADFSNGGINSGGGELDVAAPGVNVYSSFPLPVRNRRLRGTSMATPHVAGIAALFAQANPSASGRELRRLVLESARSLSFPRRDVGSGLVQAPRNGSSSVERDREGEVRTQETSPITVGGGGSNGLSSTGLVFTGLGFDQNRYQRNGSGGVFSSAQERLVNCHIVNLFGRQLMNFHSEIQGNQCLITISCIDAAGTDSPIRIIGGPNHALTIAFSETDFPWNAVEGVFLSDKHKVTSVTVHNLLTGAMTPFPVPANWTGTIRIDN